jgi:ribosomal protein S18 acetylase RimI-like enzyme
MIRYAPLHETKPEEFTQIMQAEIETWNKNYFWNFIPQAYTILQAIKKGLVFGYVLYVDDVIRGYCFAFGDENKVRIGGLFTDFQYATWSNAETLLKLTDGLIHGLFPNVRRIEAQFPHYSGRAITPVLVKLGYNIYLRMYMAFDLNNLQAKFPINEPSFYIGGWNRYYEKEIPNVLKDAYIEHYDILMNDQLKTREGAKKYITDILINQEYGPFLEMGSTMAVSKMDFVQTEFISPKGLFENYLSDTVNIEVFNLIGIMLMTQCNYNVAHIAQIAVIKSAQKRGIGEDLLRTGLHQILGGRWSQVTLTVSENNKGAVRLYEKIGFYRHQTFLAATWNK